MASKADLKIDASTFVQHAGNCGFVDLSMHMIHNIATYRARLRAIENAMLGLGALPNIPAKFYTIPHANLSRRVAKRMHLYTSQQGGMVRYRHQNTYGTMDSWLGVGGATRGDLKNQANYDIALVYALSIAFKEGLQRAANEAVRAVWGECEEFSKALINTMRQRHYRDTFGTEKPKKWEYGRKIKNINETATIKKSRPRGFGDDDDEYSYKHGDLGLTISAMKEFIQFTLDLNPTDIHYKQLLNSTDLSLLPDPTHMNFWAQYRNYLDTLLDDINSIGFNGAVMAMAYKPDLSPLLVHYDHICHWVYIPGNNAAVGVDNIALWTWSHNRTMQTWYTGLGGQDALRRQQMIPHGYYRLP